jgi:hypothetical protein
MASFYGAQPDTTYLERHRHRHDHGNGSAVLILPLAIRVERRGVQKRDTASITLRLFYRLAMTGQVTGPVLLDPVPP